MGLRGYLRPLNIVNFFNFATLRPDISKTGSCKKNVFIKMFKNRSKIHQNHKNRKKKFYNSTQNFALLPKNDHGPDFVHRILLITSDSRKCFKKETFSLFTFQPGIGQLLDYTINVHLSVNLTGMSLLHPKKSSQNILFNLFF